MKRIIRFFKKFFITLFIIVLFGLSAIIALTYIYQDEIVNYAKNHLKDYFDTEINIGSIDFSIIKKFPDATIILNDVFIKSSPTFNKKDFKINTDTLLFAKEIFLQFNLLKIIQEQYELTAIHLKKASVTLLFDKRGKNNFRILKPSSDTSNVKYKLEQIKLSDFKLTVHHLSKDLLASIKTNNFKLTGEFFKEQYSLQSKGELNIHQLHIQGVNYLKNGKATLKATLKVNNQRYYLKEGSIAIGNLSFGISGSYELQEETDQINIKITGNKIALDDLLNSLPDNLQPTTASLSAHGFIDFKAEIIGGINYKTNPRIKVEFKIIDGNIHNKDNDITLQKLSLQGKFDNGISQNLNSSSLSIDTFYTNLNDSVIYGNFSLLNFNQPQVKFKIKGTINLAHWKSLLKLDTFETLQGIARINLSYLGRIKNLAKPTATDFQNATVRGTLELNNLNLKIVNNPYSFNNFEGKFFIDNNNVQTEKTTFNLNEISVLISGTFQNLIAFLLLENQKLNAIVNIYIPLLDINRWETTKSSSNSFAIPENIKLTADISIDELRYNKLTIKKLLSSAQLSYPVFSLTGTSFQTNEGTASGNIRLIIDDNKQLTLQSNANLQQINIKKLFQSFDNFGQTFIKDNNINGKINATINFLQIRWDDKLNIIDKDIILDAQFIINNGQLVEFEPMYSLADYIELSELRQIKFSDLKNDIFIKNRKIIIPNMEIKSNAFNIEVSGEHSFDNNIEYRIKLLLREWIANKAKKNKKENMEFGIEENDGLGSTSLYLVIKGTTDNYKITYDSKKMKEQVKESLKKEKQEIKTILNQELGLFKKDSLNLLQQKKQEELKKPKFKIEWDEENPEKDQSN
ncbi:MAG: hypothetical protein N2449_04685 [Bacteroidales bacterium]|nr:hypothetical protein [Bacteroidales bacterium]